MQQPSKAAPESAAIVQSSGVYPADGSLPKPGKNSKCLDIELESIWEADICEPKNPKLNKVIPDLVFTEKNGIKAQENQFFSSGDKRDAWLF